MEYRRFPRWIPLAGVALLLAFPAVYNAGWSQGFTTGIIAGSTESSGAALLVARGGGFLSGGPGVFLFILLGLVFARTFGLWRWRFAGEGAPGWRHHSGRADRFSHHPCAYRGREQDSGEPSAPERTTEEGPSVESPVYPEAGEA